MSLIVLLESFSLLRLVPGDPAIAVLGENATPTAVAALRSQMGLDGSIIDQLARYLGGLSRGDLGISLATNLPVSTIIARSLPVTLWLMLVTGLFIILLAVPYGVVTALNRATWLSHASVLLSSLLISTPVFFSSLLLILFFSIRLNFAPVGGYDPRFPASLGYLWLPALSLCTVLVPVVARVLHSSITKTLTEEFVETAIIQGLSPRKRIWLYLLRPSLGPSIALLAYILGQMLGSAVLVELVFGLPGIGTALVNAVSFRDYTVVQGIVGVFGVAVVAIGYAAETVSALIDPRLRTT